VCVYHGVQVSYTTQHRTVLIIFPLILQTVITAEMLSVKGEGAWCSENRKQTVAKQN